MSARRLTREQLQANVRQFEQRQTIEGCRRAIDALLTAVAALDQITRSDAPDAPQRIAAEALLQIGEQLEP